MRKMLMALTAAGFIMVGGCTTTQVTDFLKLVQADAATACMFVPTIDTILAVAGALGFAPATAAAGAVTAVTAVICSQVPPPASARFQALAPQGGGPAKSIGAVVVVPGQQPIPIKGWRAH